MAEKSTYADCAGANLTIDPIAEESIQNDGRETTTTTTITTNSNSSRFKCHQSGLKCLL